MGGGDSNIRPPRLLGNLVISRIRKKTHSDILKTIGENGTCNCEKFNDEIKKNLKTTVNSELRDKSTLE